MRVARVPRRHDAIEHVDAAPHRLDDVLRPSDAHQVARLVRRHLRHQRLEHPHAFRLALADREAADRETREADVLERRERCRPQIRVHPALHDAEQRAPAARSR